MIDITDDKTGEVHELAKKHTPIYVNEVGHNNKLHRNVFIQETQQSVNYYVGIDREHAMNKGDTVELLVDYGDHYEDTRERKGYGQVNTSGYMGGDDDEASRLSRNLHEREEVEKDISTMKVYEMYHLIEFLTTNIFNRLEKVPANMRPRDLIARRRLFWIGEKLEGRYQAFLANEKRVRDSANALKEIRVWLDQWRSAASLPSIYPKIDESLRTSVHDELTEELLYQTLSLLPNPLNESTWCKVAVNLTKDATVLIGQYLYCYPGTLDALKKESLSKKLLMLAKNSALAIRDGVNAIKSNVTGVNAHIKDLSFNTPKRIIKKKNLADSSKKERIFDLYDIQDTIRYGTAASMADIQAYYDAVELCGIEPYYIPGKNKRVYDCERSIISQYDPRDNEIGNTRSPQHHWMARSVDAIKRGDASVNEQWYIENQVLLVLHILASTCVDWSSGTSEDGEEEESTETWYSLEKLCAEINLDLDKAERALSLGAIDPNWPKLEIKPSYNPSSEGNSNESRRRRRRRPAKRKVNPSNKARVLQNASDEQYPEWTVRAIQRASSHHVDNYYSHPDLPQGLIVRSRTGVKTLIDYAEANNCGIAEAYEEYKGVKKYFSTRRGD